MSFSGFILHAFQFVLRHIDIILVFYTGGGILFASLVKKYGLRKAIIISAIGVAGATYFWKDRACDAINCSPDQPNDEQAWLGAQRQGTLKACQDYINDFPSGAHLADARNCIRQIDDEIWAKAQQPGTAEGCQYYINIVPIGLHATEARNCIKAAEDVLDAQQQLRNANVEISKLNNNVAQLGQMLVQTRQDLQRQLEATRRELDEKTRQLAGVQAALDNERANSESDTRLREAKQQAATRELTDKFQKKLDEKDRIIAELQAEHADSDKAAEKNRLLTELDTCSDKLSLHSEGRYIISTTAPCTFFHTKYTVIASYIKDSPINPLLLRFLPDNCTLSIKNTSDGKIATEVSFPNGIATNISLEGATAKLIFMPSEYDIHACGFEEAKK